MAKNNLSEDTLISKDEKLEEAQRKMPIQKRNEAGDQPGKEPKAFEKKRILRTILTIMLIGVFLLLVYLVIGRPMVSFLGNPGRLQEYVNEKGIVAVLVFGLFITIQTLSTCIPGLPFYLAAGYVMGGVRGALLCDFFATVGNTIAFLIGKKYGRSFLCFLFPEDKLIKVEEMIDRGNPTLIHILFMLLPLPKDTYAWLGYYSGESLAKWVIITFLARFPHIFIYTFGGEMIMDNQYGILVVGVVLAIVVYLVVAIYLKKKHLNGK
ncbi:MAG: VTT domain-containing protein [Butyrivibrio sp.]|nr:VTT domain-containing protein [Butyrivibrio sp.]